METLFGWKLFKAGPSATPEFPAANVFWQSRTKALQGKTKFFGVATFSAVKSFLFSLGSGPNCGSGLGSGYPRFNQHSFIE